MAKMNRRSFMTTAAASAAGLTIVPRHVLGGVGYKAPSDTLNIAGIGAGGKGYSDIVGCAHENIAVLCDIDFQRGKRAVEKYPDAKRYTDYRKMLDAEPGIDAVIVSTPDHTHAMIALDAMQRGKHVYCQKPLTRTLEECRRMMAVAEESGVTTQMGNQGHAGTGTRQIREWVESGILGEVSRIEYWTNRPIWPQALDRPSDAHNVPPHVDWDLWLGPVQWRPYHPDYYHPFNWRGWWDFGTGALGDIACHAMDAAFWTFDLGTPTEVVAETTQLYAESAPAACRIEYKFPAKGNRGPIDVIWRDGQLSPPRHEFFDGDTWPTMRSGQILVGEKGILIADMYGNRPQLYPEALHQKIEAEPPAEKFARTEGPYKEWTEAIKAGKKAGSDFATHSGPLTEMVLIGNLAVRTHEVVRWQPDKLTAGSAAMDALIGYDYRDGWKLT